MGESPYCFSRPLVQFQGHIGQTRSLGRSQLSSPSDLPCWKIVTNIDLTWNFLCNPGTRWGHLKAFCVGIFQTSHIHLFTWQPLFSWSCFSFGPNRPISQMPQCIRQISHNAPFCNRNVHTCAHFCYKMLHCGIWHRCILGFVRWVYCSNRSIFLHVLINFKVNYIVKSWSVFHSRCRSITSTIAKGILKTVLGPSHIKLLFYQHRDSHYNDKTVSQPSYLYAGNPRTWKEYLYWARSWCYAAVSPCSRREGPPSSNSSSGSPWAGLLLMQWPIA